MNDLPPDALQLLDVARDAMTPSNEDRVRVRRNLLAATAALTAAGGVHASASASSMTAGSTLKAGTGLAAWLGGGAKWIVAAALTGSVASVAYYQLDAKQADAARTQQARVTRGVHADSAAPGEAIGATQPVTPSSVPVAQPQQAPAIAPTNTADDGLATIPTHARSVHALQLTTTKSQAVREHSQAGATTAAPSVTASESQGAARPQIEEEIRLVRSASVALREGRAQAALELLRQHAARFPSGMMSEERDGLRVLSLCAAGERDAAARAAAIFLARSPHSPLAAHVRKGCESAP
jgi:hypothetical protein